MAKIGIIISSIRPNRFADHPTKWLWEIASKRNDLEFEIIDLKDYPMPLFAELVSPAWGPSHDPVALRWQQKVAEMDGFIVITAEYNRGPTAAMKNAFDYAYKEWNRKPIAFVGYGATGAARAIEQLRTNAIELQMAPIRVGVHIPAQVYLAVAGGKQKLEDFDYLNTGAEELLNHLSWWVQALTTARQQEAA